MTLRTPTGTYARPASGSIRTGLSAGWAATLAVIGWIGVFVTLAVAALAVVGVVALWAVQLAMDGIR